MMTHGTCVRNPLLIDKNGSRHTAPPVQADRQSASHLLLLLSSFNNQNPIAARCCVVHVRQPKSRQIQKHLCVSCGRRALYVPFSCARCAPRCLSSSARRCTYVVAPVCSTRGRTRAAFACAPETGFAPTSDQCHVPPLGSLTTNMLLLHPHRLLTGVPVD
jgi:hypothetical protein